MTTAPDDLNNKTVDFPTSIGRSIENELHRQRKSVAWLSDQIHCDRRNIYNIFMRDSLDTRLLFRISKALGVDFFAIYSEALNP